MKRRKELLNQLSQTEVGVDWGIIKAGYFRLLYGLPVELQIQLACFMMRRYLPIFEKRELYIRWPRIFLNNVTKWVSENERYIPSWGRFESPFDSAFRNGFDGLVAAYYYRNSQFAVTSACIYAFGSAINARRSNVWAADDLEGVEIWKKQPDNPEVYLELERCISNNLAAIAVTQREWQEVGKWLWQEQVWNYPDEVNLEEMEEYLDYWISKEMLLVVPEELEMFENTRQQKDLKMGGAKTEIELDINSSNLFEGTPPKYYTIPAETPNPQIEYLILEQAAISDDYCSLGSIGYSQHLSHAEIAIAAGALFERRDIRVRMFADECDLEGIPDVSFTIAGIQDHLSGRIKAFYYLTTQGEARWEALSHFSS